MVYQRVRYKLINNDTNSFIWLENDPKNWDSSERTLKRSDKTFGVYTELSKDLIFVKDGAEFLKLAYGLKDIEADVTLEEYRYHPNTEAEYLHSTGVFDFSEYKQSKLEVKVPFKSGGLNALMQSQLREKFEIERLEAINGNEINEVVKQDVALTSRKIFLVSSLENMNEMISGSWQDIFVPNLETVSNSDTENIAYSVVSDETYFGDSTPPEQFFYLKSDFKKTITVKLNYDVFIQQGGHTTVDFQIIIRKFNYNGSTYDPVEDYYLYNVGYQANFYLDGIIEQEIDLEVDDCLVFVLSSGLGGGDASGTQNIYFNKLELIVTEESERDDSQTKAILMNDIGDKLMQIITGEQDRFYSDFFTNGDFEKVGLTTGMWIRNFYTKTEIIDNEEVEVEQTMQISLDNFLKTNNSVLNTGYHIEIINGVETLIVEDLAFYFQDAVAIRLPNQVTNVEREANAKLCHSSLEFGYKEGGEYEEAMGLDEYNVRTGFTTPLKRVDTKYSKISDARADTYGKEFARRKPKLSYPTTDTPYDKDLFLLDLKDGLGNTLEEREWDDDFEELPKGVFSPETATNLRLTPSQIEQRHQWFYGCSLLKEQDEKIRYSNTEGNNSLSTKKVGEDARSEKDDLLISDLAKPRFAPQKITFEHPVDYFVNEQLNGKTNVNGRLIPNVYFKVEFINEYNKKEYGYLMEVKPDGKGKWELLKAI